MNKELRYQLFIVQSLCNRILIHTYELLLLPEVMPSTLSVYITSQFFVLVVFNPSLLLSKLFIKFDLILSASFAVFDTIVCQKSRA